MLLVVIFDHKSNTEPENVLHSLPLQMHTAATAFTGIRNTVLLFLDEIISNAS
jgi:hypothetical protein